MLFELLLQKKVKRLHSLNNRQEYQLVNADKTSITYQNISTKTKYTLTRTQANNSEKLFEKEWVEGKDLRPFFRQSKSWAYSLMKETKKFEIKNNPLRIKWSNQK
jgi:hypothetical protein